MTKVAFIAAVYNEEKEIADLIYHVQPYVDDIVIVDDESTDDTLKILDAFWTNGVEFNDNFYYGMVPHTGLPETVKAAALKLVKPDTDWVLMLDADERFITPLPEIIEWIKSPASEAFDYVYFDQFEIIDGVHVRTFQKCKLFRRGAINFPLNDIHKDDELLGEGTFLGWKVAHRKGSYKQIHRETEYLATYKKLLDEGKIDEGRYQWLVNLHHYVKPHG